ncbi:hypothetical protein AVEN_275627-1 [Araneus ventricosus]|uniref:Uncharacterized protein n=1 Tax=Araneus ventricosus TaxID=182803 RepID=A0A4Y2R8G2_ARAVE|nr:hypothetical protein AVEN_275627-1 [Araneus ventricosus]
MQPFPLHSQKVIVWCGFTASFIVDPFFFEDIGSSGPVTCTVNGTRYESLLRNHLITALQHLGCVDSTIFMQNLARPYIAKPVKQLLNLHFGNDRIVNRHFPTTWPPESLRLLALGLPKRCCVRGPIANLAEFKIRNSQHIHNITAETLRSVMEHAVLRFQLIGGNGGQHIEHFLSKSKPTSIS